MSFINKIIAKLAGFDEKETEEATLTRTQIGHEAMPNLDANARRSVEDMHKNTAMAEERRRIAEQDRLEHMRKIEAQQHGGIQPEGLPEVIVEEEEEKAA